MELCQRRPGETLTSPLPSRPSSDDARVRADDVYASAASPDEFRPLQHALGAEQIAAPRDVQRTARPDRSANVVGEDVDDVGAAADLAVDALERVGPQLGPVLARERVEAE